MTTHATFSGLKHCSRSPGASKNHQNFDQNPAKNCLKIDENGGLGGSGSLWGALGQHLGAKEAPKSAKKSFKRGLDGQLGAKMGQLGSKMGSQIHRKSLKNRCKNRVVFLKVF